MQFYKICGSVVASEANEAEKKTRREMAHRISVKTVEFNGNNSSGYCFLSDLGEDYVTIGIISTQVDSDNTDNLQRYQSRAFHNIVILRRRRQLSGSAHSHIGR